MTDVNIIDSFIKHLEVNKKSSLNTLAAYKRDLKLYEAYLYECKCAVTAASAEMIEGFKNKLTTDGKSVATVSRCMSSVRSLYKFLCANGTTKSNPSSNIKNDKNEKKFFEVVTENEIDQLLAQPDKNDFKGMRDKAMLETLYATGMKVSELLSLNVNDVNLPLNFVRCHGENDSKHERIVLLYPKAVKELEKYITGARNYFVSNNRCDALFVNVNGDRMTRQGFWKLLKNYASDAGINKTITPHTLRHSFAAHLLENGADIHDIQTILGHSDISSTQVYAQFLRNKLQNSYVKFNHRAQR